MLAHLRADDREQAAPHTHRAPRAEHGSDSQGLPRRADAISKAGVRRPDTGRVVRHDLDRQRQPGRAIAFAQTRSPGTRGLTESSGSCIHEQAALWNFWVARLETTASGQKHARAVDRADDSF